MKKLLFLAGALLWSIASFSQGEGELTVNNLKFCHSSNDCGNIQSLTANWKLLALMGEPLVRVSFKWTAGNGTPPNFIDSRDFVVIRCSFKKSSNVVAYIRSGTDRPVSGKGYGENMGDSPSKENIFCDSKGNSLGWSAETAVKYWKEGFSIIGVSLVREGGLDADKPMVTIVTPPNNVQRQRVADLQARQKQQENDLRTKQQLAKQQQAQVQQQQAQSRQRAQITYERENQAVNNANQQKVNTYNAQVQAAQEAKSQREAAALATVAAAQRSTDKAMKTLNDGVQAMKEMLSANTERANAEAEAREEERKERHRQEAENEARKKQELEDEWNRMVEEGKIKAEKERIEKERVEAEKTFRLDSRKSIFDTFQETDIPLSNSKIEADKLYYFIYAFDANQLGEENFVVYLSAPFEIDRYSDGTWPYKKSIQSDVDQLTPYREVLHGYYTSSAEATQMYNSFKDLLSNTNTVIKSVFYKGKISSTANNNGTDFWGEPVKKEDTKPANTSTNKGKQELDYWGMPIKK